MLVPQPSTLSFYGFDGHGNVRFLTDTNGNLTDIYTYDAFGIQITPSGGTANNFRYSGQQWDPDLGMYYLRARYYSPTMGRFWTMDSYEGADEDPLSLHKYLYAQDNPVMGTDPSGHDDLDSMIMPVFASLFSHALDTVTTINFWEDPGYYGWGWPKGVKIDKWVHGTPPNSQTFEAPNGVDFLAPSGTDFNGVYAAGKANGPNYFGIAAAEGPFGTYDFQRNRGQGLLDVNTFYPAYTHASNYGVGVFMNGCGFSLEDTKSIASRFANLENSQNAKNPDLAQWWTLGWYAALGGSPNGPAIH